MTTSLEAMKAARGRLQDLRESEFYWGKFLAATRCGIRRALTLLDAAIQREEGGGDDCPVCDGARITKQEDGDEYRCRACTPTPPSGVVSREGDWTTDEEWIEGFVGDLAHDEGLSEKCAAFLRRDLAERFREVRSLSAPSEPPKASAVSREALEEAAQSLETISQEAGRAECLEDMTQVRGYAHSRATVARAALSAPSKPMVPRARALRAIREALDSEPPHDGTATAEDEAARILDGGGHE